MSSLFTSSLLLGKVVEYIKKFLPFNIYFLRIFNLWISYTIFLEEWSESRGFYKYTQYWLFVFFKLNLFLFISSKHIIYDLDILIRMGF